MVALARDIKLFLNNFEISQTFSVLFHMKPLLVVTSAMKH